MQKDEIKVDDSFVELVKTNRKLNGLTQEEISVLLMISSKKYSRIETGKLKSIDIKTYKKICQILDIEEKDLINNNRTSLLLSNKMEKDLQVLQMSKGLSSKSDTIKYCIEKTLYDFHLEEISVDLLDEIKEAISSTYSNQLNVLTRENEIYKLILNNLSNGNDYEMQQIKEMINDVFDKYFHIEK